MGEVGEDGCDVDVDDDRAIKGNLGMTPRSCCSHPHSDPSVYVA